MLSNKEEGLPEPDEDTIKHLEFIKKFDTLAEKLEQIGYETQLMIKDCDYAYKNYENKDKNEVEKEIYQQYGNMYYYMNYLRNLVVECPEPLKSAMVLCDNDYKPMYEVHSKEMNTIELIQSFEIERLFNKIWREKPEIIAQILVCMEVKKAAELFQKLHINTQIPVIEIISKMDELNPIQLARLNTLLTGQNTASSNENYLAKGGIDCVVEILCLTHKDIFREIMAKIESINSSLADEITKMMSVFEDIVMLSDNEVPIALKDVDDFDLGKALKSVDGEISKWIFRKLSKERVSSIKKQMDKMGPVNIQDVKDTQWKIIKHIRTLKKKGEL